jgi:hypothetical protein
MKTPSFSRVVTAALALAAIIWVRQASAELYSGKVSVPGSGEFEGCGTLFGIHTGKFDKTIISLLCAKELGLVEWDYNHGKVEPLQEAVFFPAYDEDTDLWCFTKTNFVVALYDDADNLCLVTQKVCVVTFAIPSPFGSDFITTSQIGRAWLTNVKAAIFCDNPPKVRWPLPFASIGGNVSMSPTSDLTVTLTNISQGWHQVGSNEWILVSSNEVISASNTVTNQPSVSTNGITIGSDGWVVLGTNRWLVCGTNRIVPLSTNGWTMRGGVWIPNSTNGWIFSLGPDGIGISLDGDLLDTNQWNGELRTGTNGMVISVTNGTPALNPIYGNIGFDLRRFDVFVVNPATSVSRLAPAVYSSLSEYSFIPAKLVSDLGLTVSADTVDLSQASPVTLAALGWERLNDLDQTVFRKARLAVDYRLGGFRRVGEALILQDTRIPVVIVGNDLLTGQYFYAPGVNQDIIGFRFAESPDIVNVRRSQTDTGSVLSLRWSQMPLRAYTVESAISPTSPVWQPLQGFVWPFYTSDEVVIQIDPPAAQCFFRVRASPIE